MSVYPTNPSIPRPALVDPGADEVVLSAKPIRLASPPERGEDLLVRVSSPATGSGLPVILFSHGYGASLEGYGPLVDYWAAHGFVVVQPTYLDSRMVGVRADDARAPHFWRIRVDDAIRVLDELDTVVAAIPGLSRRVDRSRIASVGHSFGGQTAAILLGMRVGPPSGRSDDLSDARISAGILLATQGAGGENLSAVAREMFPHINPDFRHMTRPTLVVWGDDDDQSFLTVRGADWSADPYYLSPGADYLLTVFGGQHSLGGINGYEVTEITDADPARLAGIQQLTWAYLRSALGLDALAWPGAIQALAAEPTPFARIDGKNSSR